MSVMNVYLVQYNEKTQRVSTVFFINLCSLGEITVGKNIQKRFLSFVFSCLAYPFALIRAVSFQVRDRAKIKLI